MRKGPAFLLSCVQVVWGIARELLEVFKVVKCFFACVDRSGA
jgi:hypothetical protein